MDSSSPNKLTMEKKPVYAVEGNFDSIRRCFFQVRALMSRKIIYPYRLKAKEIDFITKRIRSNPNWTVADAFEIYHILKRYKPDLLKVGIDFGKVQEPKNQEVPTVSPGMPPKIVPTILYLSDRFYFKFPFNKQINEHIKAIKGARFDREKKMWSVPVGQTKAVEKISRFFNFRIGDSARRIMTDFEDNFEQSYSAKRVELSLPLCHPKGFDLLDYQTVGVDFGIRVKRSWIADQMGLGKTVQGIGTAVGINRFPWIILCPKSLRNNWKDEIEAWTKYKAVIATKKNMPKIHAFIEHGMCDFLIVNYDGLKTFFVDRIQKIPVKGKTRPRKKIFLNGKEDLFRGMIIDEFHELRNVRTDRFKIAYKVIKKMEYRQLLTGTPLVNGPEDIAAGLTMLDYIQEFGGFNEFRQKYKNMKKGNMYAKGIPANLADLNIKLRSLCMVRREKHQVLKQLPDKFRTVVKLDIDNRKDYDHAMINLQSYLVNSGASEHSISSAARAEILVRIQLLKKLSMRGKLAQFIEFAENIISQDEKLVVFCWHLETISEIKKHYPDALEISGNVNDEEVDRAKNVFQNNPDHKLLLVTYKRGGWGHTFTAASKIAMLEFGWNPATQDQAEDRCHRIGQQNNVEIFYLLGKDTIDEWVYGIIEQKRQHSVQATGSTEEIETSVQTDLIKSLIKQSK